MAIEKDMAARDGVPLSYHRIESLYSHTNSETRIEVARYISAEERAKEKEAVRLGNAVPVYVQTDFIAIPYDPAMSVISAYEYLKTLKEFQGSTDVLEDGQTGTLDDVTPAWAAGVAYLAGDRVMHSDAMWVVLQAHTSQADWEPGVAASLFAKVHDTGGGIPEWVQPTGAHDAYAKGDRVTHNGKTWESEVDANVWEPGVYGWGEV